VSVMSSQPCSVTRCAHRIFVGMAGIVLLLWHLAAVANPLRIIVIGAHPDDADICAGGTATLWASQGHHVKFLSMTNGDAGHQSMDREDLAQRRFFEAQKSARILGIEEYQVLPNPDGALLPDLNVRTQVIRAIREWRAEVVIFPRPNDYHPDHRNTSLAIQDASYLVLVPHILPEVRPLQVAPVYLYCRDAFQKPNPFTANVAVDISVVFERKVDALAAHESQFYEWLPWVRGTPDAFSGDPAQRRAKLKAWLATYFKIPDDVRAALARWYGEAVARAVMQAEAFEICEYGTQPDAARLRQLFPMLPDG